MADWVKNPIAVAQLAVEVWVQSLAWCSELKDPVLLWLLTTTAWIWCLAQELPHATGTAKKKKKKAKTKKNKDVLLLKMSCTSIVLWGYMLDILTTILVKA